MCIARQTGLRGANLVGSPWRKGGDVTREIAAAHAGAAPGAGLLRLRAFIRHY
ncbi:environmental stress-induced protein Ves [Paraburkholderia sp. WSM4179]|nr:environmental stress-induced protein Ves [Paraburkholderia sp. WSM4179]